ncbi:DUF2163 domain-containing protein [Parasphingopyxis sp.]|uniref:DUF2163 domain-containing protein n=1 Tax=Parasphingopyxis sp. TaxID=1920299 RepID=UPI0026387D1E|nr:DUF2163 domain-containing protein [Parasphingopyxis sp.]
MTDFLAAPVATIAFCWRLARRDGVTLGFTTHDRDLTIDGLVYRSAPGMLPSAIRMESGLDADVMDVSGALTSDAITEGDLATGRWDGARVEIFAVDWEEPNAEKLRLGRGELGAVSTEVLRFTAELKGPAAMLDRPVSEMTSPECRARFGDRRCRVDLAQHQRMSSVVALIDDRTITIADSEPAANSYAYGRLRWIDGGNSGLISAILSSDGDRLTLREAPPFAVQPGAHIELTQGCDRLFATCRDRFANAENFRGEPHLPGNDLLTRYPGAG